MRQTFSLFAFILCISFWQSDVLAQSNSRSAINTLGNNRVRSIQNQLTNRPTVSPYLRLLNTNNSTSIGGVQPVYQTQVRPALEARQRQQQQSRQIQQIQTDLNRMRTQYTRPSSGYMSTGHPTRFMTYSHYYPGLYR